MGNNQPGGMYKRDRPFDSEKGGSQSKSRSGAPSSSPPNEDECPVQMKIAKSEDNNKKKFPVVFRWNTNSSTARNVAVCGSWDTWTARIPLVKSTSDFSTIVELEPGNHEYKFYVDHKWVVDDNQQKTSNHLGGENNVVMIDEADFEVFDALDKDLASSNAGEALRSNHPSKESHDTPNDRELEKLHQFGQETPTRADFGNASPPPVLPPHLLQVILNKDTPVQCDPNVLPEPDHVMLNHLYALSIKDGVMVLSATHRYRKKFVTTLLYKPI